MKVIKLTGFIVSGYSAFKWLGKEFIPSDISVFDILPSGVTMHSN
jgi:hypothetical protein